LAQPWNRQGHVIVGAPLNDGVRKEDCGAAYIFRVCPTADSDGDCQVKFLDFAEFATSGCNEDAVRPAD